MFGSRRHAGGVVAYLEPEIDGELMISGLRGWRDNNGNRELGMVLVGLRVHFEVCVVSSMRRRPDDLSRKPERLRGRHGNDSCRWTAGWLGDGIHMPATRDLCGQSDEELGPWLERLARSRRTPACWVILAGRSYCDRQHEPYCPAIVLHRSNRPFPLAT